MGYAEPWRSTKGWTRCSRISNVRVSNRGLGAAYAEAGAASVRHYATMRRIGGLASQSVVVVGDDTVVLLDALFASSTGATEVVAF